MFKTMGDAFCAVFADPGVALTAAVDRCTPEAIGLFDRARIERDLRAAVAAEAWDAAWAAGWALDRDALLSLATVEGTFQPITEGQQP